MKESRFINKEKVGEGNAAFPDERDARENGQAHSALMLRAFLFGAEWQGSTKQLL